MELIPKFKQKSGKQFRFRVGINVYHLFHCYNKQTVFLFDERFNVSFFVLQLSDFKVKILSLLQKICLIF